MAKSFDEAPGPDPELHKALNGESDKREDFDPSVLDDSFPLEPQPVLGGEKESFYAEPSYKVPAFALSAVESAVSKRINEAEKSTMRALRHDLSGAVSDEDATKILDKAFDENIVTAKEYTDILSYIKNAKPVIGIMRAMKPVETPGNNNPDDLSMDIDEEPVVPEDMEAGTRANELFYVKNDTEGAVREASLIQSVTYQTTVLRGFFDKAVQDGKPDVAKRFLDLIRDEEYKAKAAAWFKQKYPTIRSKTGGKMRAPAGYKAIVNYRYGNDDEAMKRIELIENDAEHDAALVAIAKDLVEKGDVHGAMAYVQLVRNQKQKEYYVEGWLPEEAEKIGVDLAVELGPRESTEREDYEMVQKVEVNKPKVVEPEVGLPENLENGIALMITKKLRRDLNNFGVTDEEIDKMKPKDAWGLLQQKLKGSTPKVSNESPRPKKIDWESMAWDVVDTASKGDHAGAIKALSLVEDDKYHDGAAITIAKDLARRGEYAGAMNYARLVRGDKKEDFIKEVEEARDLANQKYFEPAGILPEKIDKDPLMSEQGKETHEKDTALNALDLASQGKHEEAFKALELMKDFFYHDIEAIDIARELVLKGDFERALSYAQLIRGDRRESFIDEVKDAADSADLAAGTISEEEFIKEKDLRAGIKPEGAALITESIEGVDELAEARSEYATQLTAWKNQTREKKNKFMRVMADMGVYDKKPVEGEKPEELKAAEEKYTRLKKAKAEELYKKIESESGELTDIIREHKLSPALIDQVEKEYSALQRKLLDGMPAKERGIAGKALQKWSKIPPPARIALSTALMAGVAVTFGLGISAALGYAGYRGARAAAGAAASYGTGRTLDSVYKKRNESAQDKALLDFAKEFNPDNFEKAEQKLLETLSKEKDKAKRQRIYKALAMLAAGGAASIGTGALGSIVDNADLGDALSREGSKGGNVANPVEETKPAARPSARGVTSAAPETGTKVTIPEPGKPASAPVAPTETPGAEPKTGEVETKAPVDPEKPETSKVESEAGEKVTETAKPEEEAVAEKTETPKAPTPEAPKPKLITAETAASSKGGIQTIHNLKAEILKQYGGIDKVPAEVKTNILDKPSLKLAEDFKLYDPSTNSSALLEKSESLSLDENGNVVYNHSDGSKNVLFDSKTGKATGFQGDMISDKKTPIKFDLPKTVIPEEPELNLPKEAVTPMYDSVPSSGKIPPAPFMESGAGNPSVRMAEEIAKELEKLEEAKKAVEPASLPKAVPTEPAVRSRVDSIVPPEPTYSPDPVMNQRIADEMAKTVKLRDESLAELAKISEEAAARDRVEGGTKVYGNTPPAPHLEAIPVDPAKMPTTIPFKDSFGRESFVNIDNSGPYKKVLFKGIEIGGERDINGVRTMVLNDQFQEGAFFKDSREAFITAYEKTVNAESLGTTPHPIPFEGGKIYVVQGAGKDPNVLRMILNGREIARGVVTDKGGEISLDNSLKGSWFQQDTVYERAFKASKSVLKDLKPVK